MFEPQNSRAHATPQKPTRRPMRLVKTDRTIADLAAEHIAWARKRVAGKLLSEGTLRTLEDRYRAAILPSLGQYPLRLLAVGGELYGNERTKPHGLELVELWHEERTAVSGPTQANRAAETLRAAWLLAERRGWTPTGSSPFRFFKLFRAREAWQDGEVRVLTPNETCALMAELRRIEAESTLPSQRYAAQAIQLLALTGARRGEILSLTWPEVDLETSVLRLRGSKTGAKLVPLGLEALAVLDRVERDLADDRCFPRANWRSVFWPARKAIGAPDVTLHDLRHTWATRAIEHGVPVEMVAAALGQKTVAVTRRHYFQPDAKQLVKTANRGSRIIAGLADEGEENDPMEFKGVRIEFPKELLEEIAACTGDGQMLKREAVVDAIKADLAARLKVWEGNVVRQMMNLLSGPNA